MEKTIQTFFSNSGPLALAFPAYESRKAQVDMACMIAKGFKEKGFNCIEAATGIGKTFAYLIPSLFQASKQNQKIIISTHTIALQEQLYYKDLPFLLELLGLDMEVVLVKGMGNYLCHEKLNKLKTEPSFFKHPSVLTLEDKLATSSDGSFESFSGSITKEFWHKVSADPLSCLAHTCPSYKQCLFFGARKGLEGASILIVNHHLLLTDLLIKDEEGESSLLPAAHQLIIDEAHHLPAIAEELFSEELTLNTLEARFKPKFLDDLLDPLIKTLTKSGDAKAAYFCEVGLKEQLLQLIDTLKLCFELMEPRISAQSRHVVLTKGEIDLFNLFTQAEFLLKSLESDLGFLIKQLKELELGEKYRTQIFALEKLQKETLHVQNTLHAFKRLDKDSLFFFEKTPYNASFNAHSLHAAKTLGSRFTKHYLSTTFCSATLSFDQHFNIFKTECGLTTCQEAIFNGDFDYKKAMLFGIPQDMPEPQHPDYEQKLFNFTLEVIQATQGGVFVLFTSYDQLYKMADKLKKHSIYDKINLQVQGSDSKQKLLDNFKTSHNSVLLGTDSFWEGVDVQGEKLRCVLITKLPFRSPADPIFQATAQKLKEEGKDPFFTKSLPEACIKFKQGLGRLIRSKEDYGVVLCADMRVLNKSYGKYFLKTLPDCTKVFEPTPLLIHQIKRHMQSHQKKAGYMQPALFGV